jgi:hypothetical protein
VPSAPARRSTYRPGWSRKYAPGPREPLTAGSRPRRPVRGQVAARRCCAISFSMSGGAHQASRFSPLTTACSAIGAARLPVRTRTAPNTNPSTVEAPEDESLPDRDEHDLEQWVGAAVRVRARHRHVRQRHGGKGCPGHDHHTPLSERRPEPESGVAAPPPHEETTHHDQEAAELESLEGRVRRRPHPLQGVEPRPRSNDDPAPEAVPNGSPPQAARRARTGRGGTAGQDPMPGSGGVGWWAGSVRLLLGGGGGSGADASPAGVSSIAGAACRRAGASTAPPKRRSRAW